MIHTKVVAPREAARPPKAINMLVTLVLATSVLLQFAAAVLALRLIRITGVRWAWSLIAAGIALMAVRRCITLTRILSEQAPLTPDLRAELVALLISILMLAGLAAIGPLFQTIKRSQQDQRESQQRFRNLVDTVDAIVWEADLNRERFTFVNQRAQSLLGYPVQAWLDETGFWADRLDPKDREAAVRFCREQTSRAENHEFEYRAIAADGSTVWLSDSVHIVTGEDGTPIGLRGVMIDITERKQAEMERRQLEEELRQSQKMEAVGTLAAGIAHDFNNLLTAIFGYAELAKFHSRDAETTAALEKVELAARQAAGVTRSLLTFSRKERSEKQPLEARELVRQAVRVLRRLLPDAVEVTSDLPDQPLWMMADATQFQQVLINLAVNARDAMPDGGTLRITLERHPSSTGGGLDSVRLTVADNGVGIPPDVLPRIFEPFFTTKSRAHGTGLGMSIVHGIISDHGGRITLDSEPGRGTRAVVTIPCCDAPDEAAAPQSAPPEYRGDGELVIVAEDDQQVRAITASTLQSAGYEVVQACDGDETMRLFRAHEKEVRLIVIDVDMPKKNGPACIAEIRKAHADLPVVVTTGNVDFELDESLTHRTVLIRKPYRMSELAALAHRTLAGAAEAQEA